MNAMIWVALCCLTTPQQDVKEIFRLDNSSGSCETNMQVETVDAPFNPQDHKSIVFYAVGASGLTATFEIPAKPRQAVLEIDHLSAGAPVEFGGNSRISILVNGRPFMRAWEVGAHGYTTDRLTITKMLKPGRNSLQLRFVGGQTAYWLRRLEVQCLLPPGTSPGGKVELTKGRGDYAVVVSKPTFMDASWRKVVDALVKKHDASVIVFSSQVNDALKTLAQVFPKYACFVARPEEAGRDFVIAVHRMSRHLDADPYTDVIWGILTGYEASDALRIARRERPLLVTRAAAGYGLDLNAFEEGITYSETKKNTKWVKKPGRPARRLPAPDDTTAALVDVLNAYRPQLFATSGHATQHDWQIGYSYRNGQFRCEKGHLFGLDLQGRRFDIDAPDAKVYVAAGNCLMGLIEDRDSMALAWMHSAGVDQLVGYVVSTWFGAGGWGTLERFVEGQGRHTLAEAFYLNNQSLVHRLVTEYPEAASVNLSRWNVENHPMLLGELAAEHGIGGREALGLLWDRDTVAFYGDPAWEVRPKQVIEPAWSQTLLRDGHDYVYTLVTHRDGRWRRPPMAILPHRIEDVEILASENGPGAAIAPVITDNFILLPLTGDFAKGRRIEVRFRAKDIPRK